MSIKTVDCSIQTSDSLFFTVELLLTYSMSSWLINYLGTLLRMLCDPESRKGEVGYYLASFEAAISHIREMDLTETRDEMFSFLSIPLEDSFD